MIAQIQTPVSLPRRDGKLERLESSLEAVLEVLQNQVRESNLDELVLLTPAIRVLKARLARVQARRRESRP